MITLNQPALSIARILCALTLVFFGEITSAQTASTPEDLVTTAKVKQAASRIADRAFNDVRALEFGRYTGKAGLLVAEGDSWYDYPLFDVLQQLEGRYNYKIESVARAGDTLESMVYDRGQIATLALKLSRLASVEPKQVPTAILLSGGGNDVAGAELSLLLNHAQSELPVLNESIVSGVLDTRVRMSYLTLIESITQLSRRYFDRTIPVLIHGYDFPVTDGRGYLGGWWILPGPWFKPFFERKGYSDLQANTNTVRTLVTRFNSILENIPSTPGYEHVCYVKVVGTLLSVTAANQYRDHWNDELHPTRQGFRLVADRFQNALTGCAKR